MKSVSVRKGCRRLAKKTETEGNCTLARMAMAHGDVLSAADASSLSVGAARRISCQGIAQRWSGLRRAQTHVSSLVTLLRSTTLPLLLSRSACSRPRRPQPLLLFARAGFTANRWRASSAERNSGIVSEDFTIHRPLCRALRPRPWSRRRLPFFPALNAARARFASPI